MILVNLIFIKISRDLSGRIISARSSSPAMPAHQHMAHPADLADPEGPALDAVEPFANCDDFERIRAAVLETARGRWFLAEHARRERAEERMQLMASIRRLERVAQDNLEALRFSAIAEDVGRKLDDVLRTLPARGAVSADEQQRIEQRLIEPRRFISK
jgi:hypothetical protein